MKRTIALTLALLMLLSIVTLAGCADNKPDVSDNSGTTVPSDANPTTSAPTGNGDASADDTTSPDVTTQATPENLLPAMDFGNDTLMVYARDYNGMWTNDLLSDSVVGDVVTDSIFERNTKISELYHVKIDTIKSGVNSFNSDIITKAMAGDKSFDVVMTSIRDCATLSIKGVTQNLAGDCNKYISLDAPWWSPFLTEQLSIANKVYYATGEITVGNNRSIRTFFANKKIATDLDLPNFYSLVDNNEWTLEKMFSMATLASKDIDGDGKFDVGTDGFGLLAEATLGFQLLCATGEPLIAKNADDEPYISVGNERSVNIIDYLTSHISTDPAIAVNSVVSDNFAKGDILFIVVTLARTHDFNSIDIDYSVLPMPKYESSQEKFIQISDAYCPNAFAIPISNSDRLDIATFTLEALAIESTGDLHEAYVETCLKSKYAQDERTAEMIDIIIGNYTIDLADAFLSQWQSFRNQVQTAISEGKPISSVLKSYQKSVEKLMANTVSNIKNNPN